MATVVKNFKIKSGLVVEGTTGTINTFDILTKKQADQDYIIGLVGGSGTPDNTPDTLVMRDESGSFAANTVTLSGRLNIGSIGYIEDDSDDLVITNTDNNDIVLNAEDIRLNAQDDVRLSAQGDVVFTTNGGNISLRGNAFVGTDFSYPESDRVATQGYVDQAETDAVTSANSYTDGELENYTPTNSLDATIDGYGYLKSADLNDYATETYVNNAANTAEGNANDYTDDAIANLGGIATASINGQIDVLTGTGIEVNGLNNSLQIARQTVDTWYDAAGSAAQALSDANDYTDTAVANLVDGAPELLDTLNELAAAIADNPNYATDVANLVASKQDILIAGDNITINDDEISVTGLDTDDVAEGSNQYFTDFRAQQAIANNLGESLRYSSEGAGNVFGINPTYLANEITDGARDAVGVEYGGTPLTYNPETGIFGIGIAGSGGINLDGSNDLQVDRQVVDGWYEASGAVSDHANDTGTHGVGEIVGTTEIQTLTNKTINGNTNTITNIDNVSLVNSSININGFETSLGSSVSLDTDNVSEGESNRYYTGTRAKADAAELLTSATLSNITITGNGNGLTITAENGVAQSTTDDLAEGDDNLYYTDERVTTHIQNNLDTDELSEGISNKYFTEDRAKDAAGAALTGGTHTNVSVSYDNVSKTISLTGAVTYTDEDALDAVGEALTAGSNIEITPNDGADTITVALVDDVVIPTTGSLEVESNDFNVGAQSVGLRTSDAYTNAMAVFSIDADDDYAQLAVKNTGNGVNSSTDVIAYANNGNDSSGWVSMGITSSNFSDPDFTITGANDGYVFMDAPAGTTGHGNLVLATGANGTENKIVFAAGGLQSDNTQMTIIPDEAVIIAINTPSTSPSTGALVVDGGVGIQGDVNIQGNITFGGEGTSLTTENLAVTDPLIYVGNENAGDAVDMGIVTEYKDGATTKFAGVVRDASDGVFKIFSEATTKPTSVVNFSEAGLEYGDLKVDAIEANSANLTNVTIGMVNQDEIAHLNGVTSNIQDQLDDKLELAGGTMSGAIAMGNNKITGLATPTDNADAATKAYVDSEVSTLSNAVDDLTTSDIAEGSNLYFTDSRAVDALEAVVPNFTEVDINSVATQVAATATATGSTVNTVYSFPKASYRSAKFIVKVAHATHTEVSEVLLTLDTSDNVAITEYAVVGTNGSLSTISAEVSGGSVNLTVNPNNTSTVKVFGTLIA